MKDAEFERVFYSTRDPKPAPSGLEVPAGTTLLYAVCGNDPAKFDEALRLVRLFIESDREFRK